MCHVKGMIYWGQEAYKSLDALHAEMKDPAVVQEMFSKFDHNHDGCEFVKFVARLSRFAHVSFLLLSL